MYHVIEFCAPDYIDVDKKFTEFQKEHTNIDIISITPLMLPENYFNALDLIVIYKDLED